MRQIHGHGIVQFWECSYCERRIAVNLEDEWKETWWDGTVPKEGAMPHTCPRCPNYEIYVEQANIVLIEVFYNWGYKQWSRQRSNGWWVKIEVDEDTGVL